MHFNFLKILCMHGFTRFFFDIKINLSFTSVFYIFFPIKNVGRNLIQKVRLYLILCVCEFKVSVFKECYTGSFAKWQLPYTEIKFSEG